MPAAMTLHGYCRSAANWRARIALGLKGAGARHISHRLRRGERRVAERPALELPGGAVTTQSVAMIEWLDETHLAPPLLPDDALSRAPAPAFVQVLAADTHALQNLGIPARLRALGVAEGEAQVWAAEANAAGLAACEPLAGEGPFRLGAAPRLVDVRLAPQLGNAARFGVDVGACPRLPAAEAACMALPAGQADAAP